MTGWSRRQFAAGLGGTLALAGCGTSPAAAPAAPAPRLYFLGQTRVCAINADGGGLSTLIDHAPADGSRPMGIVFDGIAVDSRTGQIYWTDMGRAADRDGSILRCERDGSGLTTVVPPGGTFTPKQLKLDEVSNTLYWADREGMAIQRCNLDGGNIETLVITGDPVAHKADHWRWCVGIALDPEGGHIYWTQKGGDNAGEGVIRRVNMHMPARSTPANRTDMVTLFARLPEPIDLDLDLTTRTLYWTDRGDNTISRAPMDPPKGFDPATRIDRQIVVNGLKEAIGIALDLPRKRMAYTSLGGEVGVAGLDGSSARLIHTAKGIATGICWAQ